jgi:hypothetical protein
MVVIYVDDGGIFRTKENIDTLIKALSKDVKVKYIGKLKQFIGCHIIEKQKKYFMDSSNKTSKASESKLFIQLIVTKRQPDPKH